LGAFALSLPIAAAELINNGLELVVELERGSVAALREDSTSPVIHEQMVSLP
jgi:hypothetical protein